MPVTPPRSVASYHEITWPGGLITSEASGGARRLRQRRGIRAAAAEPVDRHPTRGLPCQVHDAELWFAAAPADLERAKALCGACPVRETCLAGAVERGEAAGVWGGEIFEDGHILAYKRPPGRPRKVQHPNVLNWS